jgi:hypothetical protein
MIPMRANMVGAPSSNDQHHSFDSGLPFVELLIGLRKHGDVAASVFKGDELAAIGQHDRVVERSFPALRGFHQSGRSYSTLPCHSARIRVGTTNVFSIGPQNDLSTADADSSNFNGGEFSLRRDDIGRFYFG